MNKKIDFWDAFLILYECSLKIICKFMIICRKLQKNIEKRLLDNESNNRIIIVYGARQVGKTTLVKSILEKYPDKAEYFNCDYLDVQERFSYRNSHNLKGLIGDLKFLVLDEAQRIENIGMVLKIIADEFPKLKVIATGSSSFDLSNKINEPLTGRKIEFKLFPFSFEEITRNKNLIEKNREIEHLLRFGSYPVSVLNTDTKAEFLLKELTGSYLFKDISLFQDLRKPELLSKLLQLLAFQIGSEVSFNELATKLGVDQKLVQKYIYLLEQAFVIFRLPAFSRNLRREISKSRKIYFYDLGIRNTIIQNHNPLELRDDVGALWENFCIIERLKYLEYSEKTVNQYFWRTTTQKEIDYIEEDKGTLKAFELKWSIKNKTKIPKEFLETYKNSSFTVINRDNFDEFIS